MHYDNGDDNKVANSKFNVESFVPDIQNRLTKSRENFEFLVDAYNWAQWPSNIKELNRIWPEFRRQWLRDQIRNIFNCDPQHYSKIISRIGGGKSAKLRQRGWCFARRIGNWELYHADRVLTADQLRVLPDKFPEADDLITPEDIRNCVNEMAKILESKVPQRSSIHRIDYRAEYDRLIRRVTELETLLKERDKRIEDLQGEVSWFKDKISVT